MAHDGAPVECAVGPAVRGGKPGTQGGQGVAQEEKVKGRGKARLANGQARERIGAEPRPNGGQPEPLVSLRRQTFIPPDRSGLPTLDHYAKLHISHDELRTVGYTEASRGCKHRCRHCPIVPIYGGRFRIVQPDVVLQDIRQQIGAGAEHITFGDPDFFNGPAHAAAIVRTLHEEFPDLTYDVTIKIEHLLKHQDLLPILRKTGCLFVTSAVESIDDEVLARLGKNHTRADFFEAVRALRETGLRLNPTFVAFTPWITRKGYVEFLEALLELDLVDDVAPVQYGIRLLIPRSSGLLELKEVQELIGQFDERILVYPWSHQDPRMDLLQRDVLDLVREGQRLGDGRRRIFQRIWKLARGARAEQAHETARRALFRSLPPRQCVPFLTEPWYC